MPTIGGIDFLVYSRSAGIEPDDALTEEHWAYMDRFAEGMVARGPTLATDRETWTGSLHIVGLPGADAVAEFVDREPYNRAGVFTGHLVRRFDNRLGRTMWEFPGGSDVPRFLVIAHRRADQHGPGASTAPVNPPSLPRERLIVEGELSSPVEGEPAGFVLALQAPTRGEVEGIVGSWNADVGAGFDIEIHDWEFGGRR
jgi:uncharacterized protein YciI